jgi:hypothetical protein
LTRRQGLNLWSEAAMDWSRHSEKTSAGRSSSARCSGGRCGREPRHRPFTSISPEAPTGGRWWGSSSWWMSSGRPTGPPVLCRVLTDGSPFRAARRATAWRTTRARSWRVGRQGLSSFTTGRCGMGTRPTAPTDPAARYKVPIFGVTPSPRSTCATACAQKLSPALARLLDIY